MELKKTGGQAFPSSDVQTAHAIAAAAISGIEDSAERDRVYTEVRAQAQQGMTLRDYFATHTVIDPELSVKAAETLLGRKMPDYAVDPVASIQFWAEVGARLRYIHADAMIAARGAA
jgi:hypothetical protein